MESGICFNIRTVFICIAISIIKRSLSCDPLILSWIPTLVIRYLNTETPHFPGFFANFYLSEIYCVLWQYTVVQMEFCFRQVSTGRSGRSFAHYSDVIMDSMASKITSLTIVYSTVYSGADQRKHWSSASLAFVREIHRWPVNSPLKGQVTRKMLSFDDVIMHLVPRHPDPSFCPMLFCASSVRIRDNVKEFFHLSRMGLTGIFRQSTACWCLQSQKNEFVPNILCNYSSTFSW